MSSLNEAGASPAAKKRVNLAFHVHATPAAAIAELDARNRERAEWLSDRTLEFAAAAALAHLDSDGPAPLPGDPDPAPSPLPDGVPPINSGTTPRPGSSVVDPAVPPSPGLPGGVPGGPPDVPGVMI